MEKVIEYSNISKLRDFAVSYSELAHTYIYCHIKGSNTELDQLLGQSPFKLAGVFLMLVKDGGPIQLSINQEASTVGSNMVVSFFPGQIVQVTTPLPADLDAYIMYFDMRFMQNVNINMSSISLPIKVEKPMPVWPLDTGESELLEKYFDLLHLNTLDVANPQINKQVASSLMAAMFYQLVLFYHKRLEGQIDVGDTGRSLGRRHDYVREFIRLVHLHYTRERTVTFYSNQLFISPKYLSMLVREATGRTAAKWIDDFVLTEAKNLLKFSGKNIQQVAYSLNFPTQSSFGKYFKHLTGMSPTEYQKS